MLKTVKNTILMQREEAYQSFIDLDKTFDNVPRKRVWDLYVYQALNKDYSEQYIYVETMKIT